MKADTRAFIGLDIGGTGVKAGVFDGQGTLMGFGREAFVVPRHPDGYAELPIEVLERSTRTAMRAALAAAGHPRTAAVSVSSMGQTFVTLDEKDQPLHPAILWYDSRAKQESVELTAQLPKEARQRPRMEAIAMAPKILWLKRRLTEVMKRARRYLLVPDFLAYRLTGQAVTDTITAASGGFHAARVPGYCAEVLRGTGVTEDQLSRLVSAATPIAGVTKAAGAEWGLDPGTVVVAGTNDQLAGALGAGNCRPGILSETSGTCLAVVTLTERLPEVRPAGLLAGNYAIEPYSYALAYSKTAGVVLDWFRREFCAGESWESLRRAAAAVPAGSRGIVMVPHFDGTMSPVPHAGVRGLFSGLTLEHTRADLFRSILEALAYCLRENVEFLDGLGLPVETIRSIGGGAENEVWLQIKADVLGRPVEQPRVTEAAVLGAGMLAAAGTGDFTSLAAASEKLYKTRRVFEPEARHRAVYEEGLQRYQAAVRQQI